MIERLGTDVVTNDDRRGGARPELQPDLHHGRLGRARIRPADAPAGRHARPDGQAVGRDHRDADHLELPRGAVGAPVLHLDPRRAQGSGRHRAQDRELRLPDPAAGRRGAGRGHPPTYDCGTIDGHRGRRRWSRAARSSSRSASASSGAWRWRTSSIRSPARCWSRPATRSTRTWSRIVEDAGIEKVQDPLGAHLRDPVRHVREVLRARSRPRRDGEHRRGGRRHRGAVDRRARHPAHDAHVPHRRHRHPARRGRRTLEAARRGRGAATPTCAP